MPKRRSVRCRKRRFLITVNEPEIFALNGYLKKRWPPQKQNPFLFLWALCRLIAAHRKAYAAIKKARPDATIGASINLAYYEAASGPVNHLMAGAARRWNLFFLRNTRHSLDFIGLNYYFHNRVDHGFNRNKDRKRNDMGWEIYPEGIYHVLAGLQEYKLPIYVTENGIPDIRDAQRETFIKDHLAWIKKAMSEGADVRGYFYWSLLDNFEWDSGFWPRFGLVEVDYRTMERRVRPSAFAYKNIIETWEK